MVIGFAGGGTNYFLWYGIPIPPWGTIFVSVYVISIAYAIIRYRLMDIRVIARRIFFYVFAAAFTYLIFYLVAWAYLRIFDDIFAPATFITGLFIAPLFVFLLYQFADFLRWVANRYLFAELYTYQETINRLARELNYFNDLNHIVDLLLGTIRQTLQLDRVGLVLIRHHNSEITWQWRLVGLDRSKMEPLLADQAFLDRLTRTRQALATEELADIRPSAEQLASDQVSALLPLFSGRQLVAIMFLGRKGSGEAFTEGDLELLDTLAAQAGVAVDNAMLYEKINTFNQTLKEQVDKQTAELRSQAEHLKKLLKMRSEFLDIASHQLRTPVSVILGTISMFKEGSINKLSPEQQTKFVDNIYQKSLKLNSIVKDILNASEMDTDEFIFTSDKMQPVAVKSIIETVTANFVELARGKKLELKTELPPGAGPWVLSVGDYLEQAISNLVDNAINYTKSGEIIIRLMTRGDRIIIEVADTGIGITQSDQARLFGKFKRGREARDYHTDGSGLGLFIVKKIITAHLGGRIDFQSRPGEGSTFIISLLPAEAASAEAGK